MAFKTCASIQNHFRDSFSTKNYREITLHRNSNRIRKCGESEVAFKKVLETGKVTLKETWVAEKHEGGG